MKKQLLVNAKIVNDGASFFADVLIHHGRIEKIAPILATLMRIFLISMGII